METNTPLNMIAPSALTEQYRHLLKYASGCFQGPARGFTLCYESARRLLQEARKLSTHDVDGLPAVRQFTEGTTGNYVQFGLTEYVLRLGGRTFRLLRFVNHLDGNRDLALDNFWMIAAGDYLAFYRVFRRLSDERLNSPPPLMTPSERERLWKNTVGFLQRGEDALKRFGVPLKRGVLLMGSPGNGKTTACRWLETEAGRLGYQWRSISSDDYQNACARGAASHLFQLDQPGIILFDDLDHALRSREETGGGLEQTRFLSELDGIRLRQGVVYLFTTNAGIEDLDPAFRRPGRIDHMIRFGPPADDLRREFIRDYWPPEIAERVPLERAVAETAGLSFAELDEIKKQMVLGYLDSHRWDWNEAIGMFRIRMEEDRPRKPIGFCSA